MSEIVDNTDLPAELMVGSRTLPAVVNFSDSCTSGIVKVRAEIPADGFPKEGMVLRLAGNTEVKIKDFMMCEHLLPGAEVHYHFRLLK